MGTNPSPCLASLSMGRVLRIRFETSSRAAATPMGSEPESSRAEYDGRPDVVVADGEFEIQRDRTLTIHAESQRGMWELD